MPRVSAIVCLALLPAACATTQIPQQKPLQRLCNVSLYGSGDYDGLQYAIQHSLETLEPHFQQDLCTKLDGWRIQVFSTPNGVWIDRWGREVLGLTYCQTRRIELGTDVWAKSALTHELIHVTECPWENVEHTGGWTDGTYQRLLDHTGYDPPAKRQPKLP